MTHNLFEQLKEMLSGEGGSERLNCDSTGIHMILYTLEF